MWGRVKGRRKQTELVLQERGAKPQLDDWGGSHSANRVMPIYGRECFFGPSTFWKGFLKPMCSHLAISLGVNVLHEVLPVCPCLS